MGTTVKDFKVMLQAMLDALKDVPDDRSLSISTHDDQIEGVDTLEMYVCDNKFEYKGNNFTETLISINWTSTKDDM